MSTTNCIRIFCIILIVKLGFFGCTSTPDEEMTEEEAMETPFASITTFLMMGNAEKAIQAYEEAFEEDPAKLLQLLPRLADSPVA